MLLTALMACSLQACQDGDGDKEFIHEGPVAVDLALSVAKSASPGTSGTTRMTTSFVDGNRSNVHIHYVIPFDVNGTIEKEAIPKTETIVGSFRSSHASQPFFTSACKFEEGVRSVLAYGCNDQSHTTGGHGKGKLTATIGADYSPSSIHFNLESIKTRDEYLGIDSETNTDVESVAEQIAEYLTNIANAKDGTDTWSNASNATLQLLYKNFINELKAGVSDILPGSAANVNKWVTELETKLESLSLTAGSTDHKIRTAIINAIKTADSKWNSDWKNFPGSLGLPDGAAVVRWQTVESVEKFVPETQTTTIANINNIDRFAYPAEIYYYGNSKVMVSENDLSDQFSNRSDWASGSGKVLEGFVEGPVTASTKTVAMKDPLHYGVAKLQVKMKSNAATLSDADNASVSVGTDKFPLTGIIVTGQLPVGFDFRPETQVSSYSEVNMRFVYDNQFDNTLYLTTTESGPTNTLVLQTYYRKSLKLVLEFTNNSEIAFKGVNGIVYPGTKFYLVGEVEPNTVDSNPQPYDNRVFVQDYTTTVNVTVNTLANAYNVLPDLMSPRLEMGIEVITKWEGCTPTEVILN